MRTISFVAKTAAALVSGLVLVAVFLLIATVDPTSLRGGVTQHVEGGSESSTISSVVDYTAPMGSVEEDQVDLVCSLADLGKEYAAECDKAQRNAAKNQQAEIGSRG